MLTVSAGADRSRESSALHGDKRGALQVLAAAFPPQPTEVDARFFSGQTFVSWRERNDLVGESYRIYRYDQPITAGNLGSAQFLYEVPEGSSTFWADYWPCAAGCAVPTDTWEPRFSATMPLPPVAGDLGVPADSDEGMLVWTLDSGDMIGGATDYHYAVTTVTLGGVENVTDFTVDNRAGAVSESVMDPRPLKLQETVDGSGVIQHVYVQYMDLHTFNPTLTAPNAVHQSYGQVLADPSIANAISYAFSYVVLEPAPPHGGPLPVVLKLHPFFRDTFGPDSFTGVASNWQLEENYDYDAIEIRPIDVGSTWWFGFADNGFDYRLYADECAAVNAMVAQQPAIHNFTEERVLRMVYDLRRDTGYWSGKVDTERTYVVGHSMGGGGAIAMSLRYPQLFAASYATAPVTNFDELVDAASPCVTPVPGSGDCPRGFQLDLAFDVAAKWGPPGSGPSPFKHVYVGECQFDNPPGHTQPVVIEGPSDWADHLSPYNGTPVYAWQDHLDNFEDPPAGEMVPLNLRHSSSDTVVNWPYQGQPVYETLNDSRQPWAGLVDDFLDHLKPWWFLGISPTYAELPGQGPFYGLSAVLSETVPAMWLNTNVSAWILPPPSSGLHVYNADFPGGLGSGAAVEWSSSWNPWDGAPIDTPAVWGISLRTTDGSLQLVDVSPRRLQGFVVKPNERYSWELRRLDGKRVACGCVTASDDGTLVIPKLRIRGFGRRLRIRPGVDLGCTACIIDPNLRRVHAQQ